MVRRNVVSSAAKHISDLIVHQRSLQRQPSPPRRTHWSLQQFMEISRTQTKNVCQKGKAWGMCLMIYEIDQIQ